MKAILQSLDEKVWQAGETSWTKPKEASADCDDAKIKVANSNSRALNVIFSAVTKEEFKKISSTETVKEIWTFSRQPMKELRLSRIQNSKRSLRALRR